MTYSVTKFILCRINTMYLNVLFEDLCIEMIITSLGVIITHYVYDEL